MHIIYFRSYLLNATLWQSLVRVSLWYGCDYYCGTDVIMTMAYIRDSMHCWLCYSVVAIPVYLRHSISIREGSGGKLDITVGPKQTMGKTVCTFCILSYTEFWLILIPCPHVILQTVFILQSMCLELPMLISITFCLHHISCLNMCHCDCFEGGEHRPGNPVSQVGAERHVDHISGQILIWSGDEGYDVGRRQDGSCKAAQHTRICTLTI